MNSDQHDQDAAARFDARRDERQARQSDSAKGIISFAEMTKLDARRDMIPVSYTHLDVYKRQGQ